MDIDTRDKLSALILALTKTGDLYLDQDQTKKVKSICKKSDANVKCAYDLLMVQLGTKHAQVRFSTTQLIAELFQRSHVFRNLLTGEFSRFLQLTVGIHQHKLPPPQLFADKTKQLAISLTHEWYGKYGSSYKQVTLGHDFLQYHLKVDFINLVPVTEEARTEEQRRQDEMTKKLRQKRFEKLQAELQDRAEEIRENVERMESCFEILVPKLDDEAELSALFGVGTSSASKIVEDQAEVMDDDSEMMHQYEAVGVHEHGLGSSRYRLTIDANSVNSVHVPESLDNKEIFATLRECYRLVIRKQLPLVTEWLDVLMKADIEGSQQREQYDAVLKRVINLKRDVVDVKSKSEDLGVNIDTMYGPKEDSEDDDDEEFEEVTASGSSQKAKGKQPMRSITAPEPKSKWNSASSVFAMQGQEILEGDPTYIGGTIIRPPRPVLSAEEARVKEAEESAKKAKLKTAEEIEAEKERQRLLKIAPVVPWDDDLTVWSKSEMAFNTSGLEYNHRFLGVGDGSNMISKETLERMKMRTTRYVTERPTNIKACRFPMKNGKLCMRRDLVRCPYHGKVVPRDEFGQIQHKKEEGGFLPEESEESQKETNELENGDDDSDNGGESSSRAPPQPVSGSTSVPQESWEDIEDDVHQALGLTKIEPKRKRGSQGGSNKKKASKPPSALVNLSKKPDTAMDRLSRQLNSKHARDSVQLDQRSERSVKQRDQILNRWTK